MVIQLLDAFVEFILVFNVLVTAFWMSEMESETPSQVGFHFWEQKVISRC